MYASKFEQKIPKGTYYVYFLLLWTDRISYIFLSLGVANTIIFCESVIPLLIFRNNSGIL